MTEVQRLSEIVKSFNGTPVLVVGDLIVDHYIWGKVSRISPEAPVVVVHVTKESHRPGGAGNVVKNLIELGAKVFVSGVVGDDESGRSLVEMLKELGAETTGILVDPSRPTTVKSRVLANSQQVVRVDREVVVSLNKEQEIKLVSKFSSNLGEAKGVIVSDYAKGTISKSIFDSLNENNSISKSIAGNSKFKIPVLVDPKAPNFPIYSRATVIKPNRSEAEAASGIIIQDRASAANAATVLLGQWNCDMVLITLGEDGMVLVSNSDAADRVIEVDTVARDVFDVSGAGDTVSAVFLLGLAVNAPPRDAALLANYAAGIVVGEVGTAAVSSLELLDAIRGKK